MIVEGDTLAFSIQDELAEVPWDFLAALSERRILLDSLVEWVGVFALDITFTEERESHAELVLGESFNLCVRAWLLGTELIARERQYLEAILTVLLVHGD